MPHSLSLARTLLFAAVWVCAQSPDKGPSPSGAAQDARSPADPNKPKKVWTNENLPRSRDAVSVVGDLKNKPKPGKAQPRNDAYAAGVRKQLDKWQKQIDDVSKQLLDLRNFSQGDASNNASGMKLNKNYNREPIEVQIRALEDKKKDLQRQIDTLLDEARKKGVEPGWLR